MTSMQLFGKHDVAFVTRIDASQKVCVSTEHYDTKRDVATDVSVSLFFDDLEAAARFALDMLTKVVAEMKEREAGHAETR